MNIMVVGPKGVGKTKFINKMFGKYGEEIKKYIVESDTPLALEENEVEQSYMILPPFEKINNITEFQYGQWVNYYNTFYKTYNITWVTEF